MRIRILVTCLAVLLGLPQAARPDVMEVTYSIEPDILFSGQGGLVPSFATGRLTFRYSATGTAPESSTGSGFGAVPGPTLSVDGYLTVQETYVYPPTGAGIFGTQREIRLDFLPAPGSLTGANGGLVLPLVRVAGTSSVHCSGSSNCDPETLSIPQTAAIAASFPLTVGSHLATTLDPSRFVGATLPIVPPIVAIQITAASEISRHFLPEPHETIGLTAGAVLLVALVARRQRPG